MSAVIVHYRTSEETIEAVKALAAAAPDVEVVVVDNASGDEIARRLQDEAPGARLLVEERNSGYGAACAWAFGNDIPGHTVTDFGGLNQYGPLLRLRYLAFGGQGATLTRLNNFRQILDSNPCTP